MKMLILPTVVALALMSGGAVFAADSSDADNAYLYAQPSPFAVPQNLSDSASMAAGSDRRLDPASQRASMNGSDLTARASSPSAAETDNPAVGDPFEMQGPE